MIYKIRINQYVPYGMNSEFIEYYDSVETLRLAFEQINSEVLFGEIVKESITPNWETDTYSEVVRKMGNCTTTITSSSVFPMTKKNLDLYGAFSTEKSLHFLRMYR